MSVTPTAPRAPAAQTTTLAVQDADIVNALQAFKPNLEFFAPAKLNVDTWLQTALLCIVESKKLRDALTTDKGKKSLIHALKYGIATGLSLNPQEGKAALIPFGDEIVFMPMKNGLCDIALDTGTVEAIDAEAVRENDEFRIHKTAHGDDYDFAPARKNRGGIDGFFAYCRLTSGKSSVRYMTVDEINTWRDTKVPTDNLYRKYDDKWNDPPRYKKGDKIEDSIWWKNPEAAALKTVTKVLLNSLHIPSIDKAVEQEEQAAARSMRNVTPPEGSEGKGTSPSDLAATLAEQADAQPAEGEEPGEQEARAVDAEVVDAPQGNVHTGATTSSAAVPPKAPPAPAAKPAPAAEVKAERPPVSEDTICGNPKCKKEFHVGDLSVEHRKSWKCPACGGELAPNSLF